MLKRRSATNTREVPPRPFIHPLAPDPTSLQAIRAQEEEARRSRPAWERGDGTGFREGERPAVGFGQWNGGAWKGIA